MAKQERTAANSSHDRILTLYHENKDELCDRSVLGRTQQYGERIVIRSRSFETALKHDQLSLGCENWQLRERGYAVCMYLHIDN